MAQCVAEAVIRDELVGKTVEVGGPEHLTYNDIIDIISRILGVRRLKLHIPVPIMGVMVRLMEAILSKAPRHHTATSYGCDTQCRQSQHG